MTLPAPALLWEIFCRVIDNWGDLGVCWRLAASLAQRGQRVRLWVDQPDALAWMAPPGHPGVQVQHWSTPLTPQVLATEPPGPVWIEAFGCEIAPEFIAAYASGTSDSGQNHAPLQWFNLEYLSAEPWVERCHALPSPVHTGPGQGLSKRFYFPGFTPRTAGLLREADLLQRQARFEPHAWLQAHGLPTGPERRVSLFCYEPAGLPALLQALAADGQPTRLLVTPGRAAAALKAAWAALGWPAPTAAPQHAPPKAAPQAADSSRQIDPKRMSDVRSVLQISYLPALDQADFDALLWVCDLNCVRGEDSLVRALWAGRPFIWHIYPQHDDAHHAKLRAFLDWLNAPPSLRQAHASWNALPGAPPAWPAWADVQPAWQACAQQAQARALQLPELTQSLLEAIRPPPQRASAQTPASAQHRPATQC